MAKYSFKFEFYSEVLAFADALKEHSKEKEEVIKKICRDNEIQFSKDGDLLSFGGTHLFELPPEKHAICAAIIDSWRGGIQRIYEEFKIKQLTNEETGNDINNNKP